MSGTFYNLETFFEKIKDIAPFNKQAATLVAELDTADKVAVFFSLLQEPETVSAISEALSVAGYAQQNLPFPGAHGTLGDEIVINRWRKAASGSIIMPTRFNRDGELEILFGIKRGQGLDVDYWALPGGHYELDQHQNLEHALVAEIIEETGIVPLIDDFIPYIIKTIEDEKDKLPYRSLDDAPENLISRDLVWELITVISGFEANITKHSINAGYRIHFKDGMRLTPEGNDDLGRLKWFKLSEIEFGDKENYPPGTPLDMNKVMLSTLLMGQDKIIEMAIRKMRAWELCEILAKDAAIEDLDFFIQHLHTLRNYSHTIESHYGLVRGSLLRNCLVGKKWHEYLDRALTMHKLLPHFQKELHLLEPGKTKAINLIIEKQLLDKFA